MATLIWSARALDDVEQSLDALRAADPAAVSEAARVIASAAALLADHPLAGQPLASGLRQLVVSTGATGHLLLYRFVPARRELRLLTLAPQRALGFRA